VSCDWCNLKFDNTTVGVYPITATAAQERVHGTRYLACCEYCWEERQAAGLGETILQRRRRIDHEANAAQFGALGLRNLTTDTRPRWDGDPRLNVQFVEWRAAPLTTAQPENPIPITRWDTAHGTYTDAAGYEWTGEALGAFGATPVWYTGTAMQATEEG
jgi:hypothetical protein